MADEEAPDLLQQTHRTVVQSIKTLAEKAASSGASGNAEAYASAARQLAEVRAWLLGKH